LKPFSPTPADTNLAHRRERMLEFQLRQRGIGNERVLAAMTRVPRHEFIAEPYRDQAYDDNPLPIGYSQTISQPYIVALMVELLSLESENTVLEIGTGSGYQTALLAELSRHVYSIERHAALAAQADAVLRRLGYSNITILVGDGTAGLPALAPFDAIIVSAAAPEFPRTLFEQLREGGRMVVPVGPIDCQQLELIAKEAGSPVVTREVACRFVPLIGEKGYSSD
jgi:protein-L-isoaspartate(D-aspartate) O-methyltransferase